MAAKMHQTINNFISQKLLCRSWWNLVQMFIGGSGRILCKKIAIGLRSWAAILKNVARKWRKISKLSELNETQYLGYFGDGEQDEAIKMAAISTWPPRATSAIARNCNSSYYSSSFLTLNLSIAFLKDGQAEFYKTLGYDSPAYLVVHPSWNFWFGVGQTYFLGSRRGGGSNIESYGENFKCCFNWL